MRDLHFTFDGERSAGFAGDTLALALIRSGRFTTRRDDATGGPRGYFCGEGKCQECRLVVDGQPDVCACRTDLRDGMNAATQAGLPDLGNSVGPVAEPVQVLPCDFAVIGGGPAGCAAALALHRLGSKVLLIEAAPVLGGKLLLFPSEPLSPTPRDLARRLTELAGGLRLRGRASGFFEDGSLLVGLDRGVGRVLAEDGFVIATGTRYRPALFEGWTLPGVFTEKGFRRLLFGPTPHPVFHRVAAVGDAPRLGSLMHDLPSIDFLCIESASASSLSLAESLVAGGSERVRQVALQGVRQDVDALVIALPEMPDIDLWRQGGGPFEFSAERRQFEASARQCGGPAGTRLVLSGSAAGRLGRIENLKDGVEAASIVSGREIRVQEVVGWIGIP